MWVLLLFILAVPLFFFWSDSALTLLPSLQPYLPDAKEVATAPQQTQLTPGQGQPGVPSDWVIVEVPAGYVAWLPSEDNKYRLAVGCQTNTAPVLQVTPTSPDSKLPDPAALAVDSTWLPLAGGVYQSIELIGHVATMQHVHLYAANTNNEAPSAITGFLTERWHSGVIARALQQHCR